MGGIPWVKNLKPRWISWTRVAWSGVGDASEFLEGGKRWEMANRLQIAQVGDGRATKSIDMKYMLYDIRYTRWYIMIQLHTIQFLSVVVLSLHIITLHDAKVEGSRVENTTASGLEVGWPNWFYDWLSIDETGPILSSKCHVLKGLKFFGCSFCLPTNISL